MTDIHIPALRGDDASGFLAALGVVRILGHGWDPRARLAWPDGPRSGVLVQSSAAGSLDQLSALLAEVAAEMVADDELLLGAGPDFPPRKVGKDPDPTRSVSFERAADWARRARVREMSDRWLASTFATNDATLAKDGSSELAGRNPVFDAGPGTVSMSSTLAGARDEAAEGGAVARSLQGAGRRAGNVGGYLDWRADRDAAEGHRKGDKTTNYGDPVRTWLGLNSLVISPVVQSGDRVISGLVPWNAGRRLRKPLVWPVWSAPRTFEGAGVLLTHPSIAAAWRSYCHSVRPDDRTVAELDALRVSGIYGASRLAKGNNDGAIGPTQIVWGGDAG